MLRAMFLLAFNAFLRVGEMTYTGSLKQHFILVKPLKIISEDKQDENLQLTIPHSKHSHKFVTLQIPKNQNLLLCLYVACKEFLYLRAHKSSEEPLFSFVDGAPESRKFFTEHLQRAISACGLPMQRYQAHSFASGLPLQQRNLMPHTIRSKVWAVGSQQHSRNTYASHVCPALIDKVGAF